jgi:hypothetical protein
MNTNNQTNQSEKQTQENTRTNTNDTSKEVDLPVPEKKNDDITTGTKTEKGQDSNGATVLYDDDKAGKTKEEKDNGKSNLTGKDAKITTDDKEDNKKNGNEKRGGETKRLERDETANPKTQDAEWQHDKMNEANNQQGDKGLMVEGSKTGSKNKGEDSDVSGTKKDQNDGGQTKDANNPDQRRRQNEERERQQKPGKTGSTSKDTRK